MKKIFTKILFFVFLLGSFSFSNAGAGIFSQYPVCLNDENAPYLMVYEYKINNLFTKIENNLMDKTDDEKIIFYNKINNLIESYYTKLPKQTENIKIIRVLQAIECISEQKIYNLKNSKNIFNEINNFVEKENKKINNTKKILKLNFYKNGEGFYGENKKNVIFGSFDIDSSNPTKKIDFIKLNIKIDEISGNINNIKNLRIEDSYGNKYYFKKTVYSENSYNNFAIYSLNNFTLGQGKIQIIGDLDKVNGFFKYKISITNIDLSEYYEIEDSDNLFWFLKSKTLYNYTKYEILDFGIEFKLPKKITDLNFRYERKNNMVIFYVGKYNNGEEFLRILRLPMSEYQDTINCNENTGICIKNSIIGKNKDYFYYVGVPQDFDEYGKNAYEIKIALNNLEEIIKNIKVVDIFYEH